MKGKYVVSWYEAHRMLVTNQCKTFVHKDAALDYYYKLLDTKENDLGYPITRVSFSIIEEPQPRPKVALYVPRAGDQGYIKSGCPFGKKGYTIIGIIGDMLTLYAWDSTETIKVTVTDFEPCKRR